MVAPALCGSPVRGREQRVDLWLFEIGNDRFAGFFEGYRTDLPGPFDMYWVNRPGFPGGRFV